MNLQVKSSAERGLARSDAGRISPPASAPAFVDQGPGAVALRKLSDVVNGNPRVAAQRKLAEAMHDGPRITAQRRLSDDMSATPLQRQEESMDDELLQGRFAPAQRQGEMEDDELLQGRFAPVQRQGEMEDDKLLQGRFAPVQRVEPETDSAARENNTGLPGDLKAGIESLSGVSLDNVKVHYNSSQPAQLNALAYAQGSDIHVAPGQEQHLPHEAWHVVQQAQGRVQPTTQMKDVSINDDQALELEADRMGAQAQSLSSAAAAQFQHVTHRSSANDPIQRVVPQGGETSKPVAGTGSYVARGGQSTIFDSDQHPRSQFSFGSKTRNEVFSRYNPQYVGNRIVSIRSSHGEQVNVEGIQLDHQNSWDRIAEAMTAHNRTKKAQGVTDMSQYYTLWDAKMYYNDQSNLVPALGALNAAGGAEGVGEIPRIHYGLESVQGTLQTSWMNLQAGLVAVGGGMSDAAVEEVAILMLQIARAMNDVTERLL